MADVTEAPTQDAIAESLMGDAPVEQQTAEQPVTEQPQDAQQAESQPQVEQQEQFEETAEDWLPQEQDKVFPEEVLVRYAQRYGLDENRLADPLIRQIVHDKINSDIYIQQLREQEQQQQIEPEPTPEPTREAPPITAQQYFQSLEQFAQAKTNPESARWFHGQFLRAFGVPEAEIAKIPADQAIRFGQVATAGIANVANTIIDDLLQTRLAPLLSQVFPGFDEMYERSSYAMAWDRVRNSNPQYSALPAYGTKEFSARLREASARVPGFDEMQFTDATGKALPMMDNAMRKYGMLAQIASGQAVDPRLVQQAAAAGAAGARRAQVRRAAGNLGSGQSKAASGSQPASRFQTNTDIFSDETMEIYKREHGRL